MSIPDRYRDDPDVALAAYQCKIYDSLDEIDCLKDEHVMMEACSKAIVRGRLRWSSLPPNLIASNLFVLRLRPDKLYPWVSDALKTVQGLSHNPSFWWQLCDAQDYKDITLHGLVRSHAKRDVLTNAGLARRLCEREPRCILELSYELCRDTHFVQHMLKTNCRTLDWLTVTAQNKHKHLIPAHFLFLQEALSKKEMYQSVMRNMLDRLSPEITGDGELMKLFFAAGLPFTGACEAYSNDSEMMLIYLRKPNYDGDKIGPKLAQDKEFVVEALAQTPSFIAFINRALQNDMDVLYALFGYSGDEAMSTYSYKMLLSSRTLLQLPLKLSKDLERAKLVQGSLRHVLRCGGETLKAVADEVLAFADLRKQCFLKRAIQNVEEFSETMADSESSSDEEELSLSEVEDDY